ncbi:MAG TPA: 2Fe-2S iron-sulfur cluster-binding protein [Anaeromyxobacter sp.]|nr:2Fe-2S iron-sulfur cluster-binding protein [Anaeromyxobacter sp.]
MAEDNKPQAAPPPKPAGPPPPPPPKNPGLVTATIDGREVVAKPGTSVIEAARSLGITIPYYCYHKRLSVAANCRMCLVEMSNAPMGKLMPACQMPLAEGVVVKTDTPRVKDQQRATLEFLLLSHPVDCAICDQAGECKLQDYYQTYDAQPSRLDIPKVKKAKRVWLGPLVTLDQERCILCTRCVRFMREVAKEPQLGVAERGTDSFIETFPGQPLDSKYAGNVVDICPVGALTSTDFRFRGRVWFMSSARSICTGCSRGCNTFLDYLSDTSYRYRPRENDAVNQEWMCDDGRLSYKPLNRDRVLSARVGRSQGEKAGEVVPRQAAVARAAQLLSEQARAGRLALLLSPSVSLEDALVTLAVAREGLSLVEAYLGGRPDGWQDQFLKRADENPNRRGLELAAQGMGLTLRPFADLLEAVGAGEVRALWAVGTELPSEGEAVRLAGLTVVAQATNDGPLARAAEVLLPASPHAESDGTFVNFEGRAQRFEMAYFPRGDSRPHWSLAGELGRALGVSQLHASAREAFAALGPRLGAALGDFRWDSLPSVGKRPGLVPLAAGTVDGRLPGYRERVPSEGSEDQRRALARLPQGGRP